MTPVQSTNLLLTAIIRGKFNENALSAGIERIDCIGKCHSGLWEATISPSNTAVLVILAVQRYSQFVISPIFTAPSVQLQFKEIACLHIMSCTQHGMESYRLRVMAYKTFLIHLTLYSVLYNVH